LGDTQALDGFKVTFAISGSIKVWTSTDKTEEITGSTIYVLGTASVPASVYVEGITAGAATLQATITDPDDEEYKTDTVLFTVYDINLQTDSENDGDLDEDDDALEDAEEKRIFINKDDDDENGKPDKDDTSSDTFENDFAETKLEIDFPEGTDFTGIKLRLTLDAGLKAWNFFAGTKETPLGATVNGNVYEWDLGGSTWISPGVDAPTHTLFPNSVWIEGISLGAGLTAKLELLIGGEVKRTDTTRYSVEEIVWPFSTQAEEWQDQPTSKWVGLTLPDAWYISKSLVDYIKTPGEKGSIETIHPDMDDGKRSSADGADAVSTETYGNNVTLDFNYEFELRGDNGYGYVQANIPNWPDLDERNHELDRVKVSFVGNSGVKFSGTEINILDVAKMVSLAGGIGAFTKDDTQPRGPKGISDTGIVDSDSRLIENRSGCVVKVQLARLAVRSDSKLAAILALVFGGGRAFN